MFLWLFPLWCVCATLVTFILSELQLAQNTRNDGPQPCIGPPVIPHPPLVRGKLLINESLQLFYFMVTVQQGAEELSHSNTNKSDISDMRSGCAFSEKQNLIIAVNTYHRDKKKMCILYIEMKHWCKATELHTIVTCCTENHFGEHPWDEGNCVHQLKLWVCYSDNRLWNSPEPWGISPW